MRKIACPILPLVVLAFLWMAGPIHAEEKLHDKVTAYVHPGSSDHEIVIDVWMSNLNPVIGITLPFKFASKANDSLAFDSLSLSGGRAAEFKTTKPLFNAENQTFLLNMIWKLDTLAGAPAIPPGEGPLIKLYLSAPDSIALKDFRMATVQLPPQNTLLYVTETLNTVNPDFEFALGNPLKEAPKLADPKKMKGESKSP